MRVRRMSASSRFRAFRTGSGGLPVGASSDEVEDATELSVRITAAGLQLDGRDRRDVGVGQRQVQPVAEKPYPVPRLRGDLVAFHELRQVLDGVGAGVDVD